MRFIYVLILFFIATAAFSQENKPSETIYKGIRTMKQAASDQDYLLAIEGFDKAVAKMPKDWIPKYYAALGRIFLVESSFFKSTNRRDEFVNKSIDLLGDAAKLSQDEEVSILKAYIDVMKFSRADENQKEKIIPSIQSQLDKIKTLNPANPRLMMTEGVFYFYCPEHLGGKNMAQDLLQQAKQLFADGEFSKYMLMPTWGESIVHEYLTKINNG